MGIITEMPPPQHHQIGVNCVDVNNRGSDAKGRRKSLTRGLCARQLYIRMKRVLMN